jgi:hypothetical protein
MHVIQVGRRRLNLQFLVMDEEFDGTPETAHLPPGGVRVTMVCGKEFDLTAPWADVYRRQVAAIVEPDPGKDLPMPKSTTVDVDPRTGQVIPRKRRVRKEPG